MVKNHLQYRRPGFDPWVGEIPWRREWLSTAVFLPGESHGQRSLVGCSPRGGKELDTTEQLVRSLSVFRTWKQPRYPSTDEQIQKPWQTDTKEYYSVVKRNTFELVLMRQMNLEPIIQNEVNQERGKHILTYIYRVQKDGTDESIFRAAMERQTQSRDLWTQWGKERVGQMETLQCIHTDIYTLPYVKLGSQWEFAV